MQEISTELLDEVVEETLAWSLAHGLLMGGADGGKTALLLLPSSWLTEGETEVIHAPTSLFPSPLPRSAYDQVVLLARDFNVLVHKVSNDHSFLCSSLER